MDSIDFEFILFIAVVSIAPRVAVWLVGQIFDLLRAVFL